MLTQIEFEGELKLLDKDEELEDREPHKRWAKSQLQEQRVEYSGPERRRGERRKTGDRREFVRFEAKPDRRSGKDRRKGAWDIKHTI
jgi:hypothetical protein